MGHNSWEAPIFFDKGDTVDGTEMDVEGNPQKVSMSLDYSDIGAPPLHVSCRCYIRPEEIALVRPVEEIKEPDKPPFDEIVRDEVKKHLLEIVSHLKEEVRTEMSETLKMEIDSAKNELASKIDHMLDNEE